MIEIGVHKGQSLKMWCDYFPNINFIGIDLADKCKIHENKRVTIEVGSQVDSTLLEKCCIKYNPLIILDDGSHVWEHQITTFEALFPLVQADGYYIIEDIHTSFGENYKKIYGGKCTQISAFKYFSYLSERVTANKLIPNTGNEIENFFIENIEFIVFFKNIVLIKKNNIKFRKVFSFKFKEVRDLKNKYSRITPSFIHAPNKIIEVFNKKFNELVVTPPGVNNVILDNVIVIGNGVIIKDNLIIEDTIKNANNILKKSETFKFNNSIYNVKEVNLVPSLSFFDENTDYILVKQIWDQNYGHWLVDTLPKILQTKEMISKSKVVYVLGHPNANIKHIWKESLNLLGIPNESIILTNHLPIYFKRLLYTSPLTVVPNIKNPLILECFNLMKKNAILKHSNNYSKKIYVSRNKTNKRKLINEENLLPYFKKYGYRIIYPETLSLEEQINVFSHAEKVIGNLGANLANLVFCPRGVSVFVLTSEYMLHDYFYDITCIKEGSYTVIQGNSNENNMNSDFTIDEGLLLKILKSKE